MKGFLVSFPPGCKIPLVEYFILEAEVQDQDVAKVLSTRAL